MMQQRRFAKEFEEEAVRLVQTSGRTQREIAGDLGIGLSTTAVDVTALEPPGSTQMRPSGTRLEAPYAARRQLRPELSGQSRRIKTQDADI
jgi:transposase-like protein